MTLKHNAILTDLYQLTMAAGYWEKKINYESTFELFVRKLPEHRSFLVAAGVEQCLNYLMDLKFSAEEIDFLKNHPTFKHVSDGFFEYLKDFRFTGDVWAVEEGTIFFPNEPVIRVTAPTIEAQLVETYLLSMFNFQTLIATKAARIYEYSRNKPIVEFGTRRAHSPEAGLLAARAGFIGGCNGTSNVLAGKEFGIPIFGTMAHSWVMAFEDENEAFKAYADVFPESTTLLIDTYDTLEAAKNIVKANYNINAVRLDSGDLGELSKKVRDILDKAGKNNIKIMATGDLNEYSIKELLENDCPIDIFGVGTELATSKDAPALGGVYKLVEQIVNGTPIYKAKFSANKMTYPAKKQVYRILDEQDHFSYDMITLENESKPADARPLLKPAIKNGNIHPDFDLNIYNAQKRCLNSLNQLPLQFKQLQSENTYKVIFSSELENKLNQIKQTHELQIQ